MIWRHGCQVIQTIEVVLLGAFASRFVFCVVVSEELFKD